MNGGGEFIKALDKIGLYADAKDGPLADLHHVDVFTFNKRAVNADFAEFVY